MCDKLNKLIRDFVLTALDDDDGITYKSYDSLSILLISSGNEDIIPLIESTENRMYIDGELIKDHLMSIDPEIKD